MIFIRDLSRAVERGGKGDKLYPGPRSVRGAPRSLGGKAACRGEGVSDRDSPGPQIDFQRAWISL